MSAEQRLSTESFVYIPRSVGSGRNELARLDLARHADAGASTHVSAEVLEGGGRFGDLVALGVESDGVAIERGRADLRDARAEGGDTAARAADDASVGE